MAKVNGITTVNNYNVNTQKISTDNSSDFSSYLGESKSLDQIFGQAADKYNVPVELLKAIGKTESNFDTDAVSRCGAQGVMQLMPSTAKGLGVTNSFDAEQNIMGGAKYISGLLKKYDGNTKLALAAYNAGSGNVAKYGGIPPFTETQNYVKKVTNYMNQGGIDTLVGDNSYAGNSKVNSSNTDNDISAMNNNSSDNNVLHVAAAVIPTPIRSNYAYLLTNDANTNIDSINDLDTIFSYDDYMKFLDMFMDEAKQAEENEKKMNYSTKDINYNAPVLNLLLDQKTI